MLEKNGNPSNKTQAAKRRTALAGAALAATALTAAVAPPAAPTTTQLDVALAADNTDYPMFTIGPLGGLITPLADALGFNPFTLPVGGLSYEFSGGAPTTRSIYNLFNDLAYTPVKDLTGNTCTDAAQKECRTGFALATGLGALGTTDAIYALIEAAQGDTRPGFDDLKPANGTGMTQVSPIYVNNMLRPDGGMASRFPDLVKLFGLNPAMPPVGEFGPDGGGTSVYNWITDLTWPYNGLSDFPITANPFSLVNSWFASIPPISLINILMGPGEIGEKLTLALNTGAGTVAGENGLGPFDLPPDYQCGEDCGASWARLGVFYLLGPLTGDLPGVFLQDYAVLGAYNADIPLTYPTYLASFLTNPILKAVNSPYLLGTPLADVLTPALKILVNIGYDDVITPDKLNTVNPRGVGGPTYAEQNYTAYDRTFSQPTDGKPVPFAWFNNPALTAEQTTAAYGDAWKAFTGAVKAQTEKPLWGILVPNPDNPPAETAAAVAAPTQAAAEAAPVLEADPVNDDIAEVFDEAPAQVAVALDADIAEAPAEAAAPAALKSASEATAAAGDDSGGNTGRAARHGGRGSN